MSINNKRSYTEYTVTQPTTDFAIGFDDFDEGSKDNILVTLNGVLVESLGYAAIRKNESTVTITPAITEGTVRLTRETDIDEPFHKFTAGALFSAKSMDENFQQVRHSQQEVRDGFVFLEYNTNGIVQESKVATAQAKAATVEATASAVRAETAADTAVQAVGSLQGVVVAATTATTNANAATATATTAASQASAATTSAQNAALAANTAKQEATTAAASANAATVDTLAATGRANEAADVVADLVVGKVRAQDVSTSDGSTQAVKNTEFRNELDALPFVDGVLADTFVTTTVNGAGSVARTQRDINAESISIKDFIKTTDTDRAIAIRAAQLVSDEVLIPYGTYNIDSNLSVTARLVFQKGARLRIAAGVVVTFTTGEVSSGINQVFTGDGEVRGLLTGVPEWFGAKGGGVIDDTQAVKKARDSSKSHSLDLYSLYGISELLIFNNNNSSITGRVGNLGTGFISLSAAASIQLGTSESIMIYQGMLNNFVFNGKYLTNTFIKFYYSGEFKVDTISLVTGAPNAVGVDFASRIAGIMPILNLHTNGVGRPVYFSNKCGNIWFSKCNFYNSKAIFSSAPNVSISNIVVRDTWMENFENVLLLDSSLGHIDVFGFNFDNCYFQSTFGGVDRTARIVKVVATSESFRNRVKGLHITGGNAYMTNSDYYIDVMWNGKFGDGQNSFTGSIDGLTSTSPSGVKAWLTTDATTSTDAKFFDFKFGRKNISLYNLKPSNTAWNYNKEVLTINSATPSVKNQSDMYVTKNTSATSISNILDGVVGNIMYILIGDAFTTFKFAAGTSFLRGNSGVDYVAKSGDLIQAIYSGNLWHCTIIK